MLAYPLPAMELSSSSNVQFSSRSSKKREFHGPRPTPLKLCGDSYQIKKPPRPPIIIYAISPKIIHAKPDEFMALVQRLTGKQSSDGRRRKVKSLVPRHVKSRDVGIDERPSSVDGERDQCVAPTASQLFSATLAADADSGNFDDIFTSSEFQSERGFSGGGSNFQSTWISSHVANYPSQSSTDLLSSRFDL